jgi:dipeptidyl aminopeptidase/acylaminoacyl peptidase
MKQVAPYGEWSSPITTRMITAESVGLTMVGVDGDRVVWTELRPSEGGRTALVQARLDGTQRQEWDPGLYVRTLVHEYGGGAARAARGLTLAVKLGDQRIWRLPSDPASGEEVALTPPGDRYADLEVSPDGRWVVAVCERPHRDREHENLIVAVPLDGGEVIPLVMGHDFYASPRFSPDGRTIAFITWDHPAMPWDGTTLWTVGWDGATAGEPRRVAGGPDESVLQPRWSPAGRLTFVSDRSGWWNLFQQRADDVVPLTAVEAELARPPWTLGQTTYGFVDEQRVVAVMTDRGVDRLVMFDLQSGTETRELAPDLVSVDGLSVSGARVAVVAATATSTQALFVLDVDSGARTLVARSLAIELDPEDLAAPEVIEFPGAGGARAYAFFYAPRNARHESSGELPPLIVQCHGGPTAAATPALRLPTQFWTSRGIAVADVNYGGSSGYGRAYRDRLKGAWGVVDLEDCCGAARYLVAQGRVDGQRLAIRGGSAGGYTALCAVTFADLFAVGASYYGVADLERLALDTHKFESRYLDSLVGKLPEDAAVYHQRSPIHHVERLHTPLIILQGLEDKVVPPAQAELMVAALERRQVTYAYVKLPDEAHGFRRAASIERAMLAELAFYGHVFGFAPSGLAQSPVEIRHPRAR